MIRPTLY